ncbi:MAG TPA: hypothetical protein PLP61_11720 [Nocardioides sp.]|uniref:hypothetical protein n=1 Tax=Nocardioides sp. TaxID=35761 RepID=UPI002C45D35E|nr:hypothetical protein [Nocardioides sp.]HQR27698.1 hypothetical protein [Nocardioides sp.]
MEILLWLVPPVVVTVAAMLWVSWLERERGEVDPEVAAARMGRALSRDHRIRYAAPPPPAGDRSTGVVVRTSRPAQPAPEADAPRRAS